MGISEIPLSDIKTKLETKIKEDVYNECIEEQFGYWEKLGKIDYCNSVSHSSPWDEIDIILPKKMFCKLLDKSTIENYEEDYEIKLYVL